MIKNSVDIITLGCSKNLVDSERLMHRFAEAGYKVRHDPEKVSSEFVVVNTCGFIGDAKEESIEMMKYCRPDFDKWLCGFHKVENSVENSVNLIRKHPLIPDKVQVSGYVIDATTGQLNPVI